MTSHLRSAKAVSVKFTATALDRQWRRWKGSYARFIDALDTREVPYLSYSKVSTVERCPQCYLNQYVLGQQPSSNALTTGTLFHKAAEAFYDALCSGQPLSAATVSCRLHPKHKDRAEQARLDNAIKVMMQNAWEGYDILATEGVIFLDLAPRLPPVIGVADLILRKDGAYVVVDHKTSKRFNGGDAGQLLLYAEHVRRRHGAVDCIGAFDEYRLVPDLKTVRKAVFRRTPVAVAPASLAPLVERFRRAWTLIAKIHREREATPAFDCYYCNPPNYNNWY